jgi:hypothetical protein
MSKQTTMCPLWFWEEVWSPDERPWFAKRTYRLYPGSLTITEYGTHDGAYAEWRRTPSLHS